MRERTTTVYTYDELSDSAKATARDWWTQHIFNDSCDWDFVYEYAVEVAKLMGIEVDTHPVKLMGGGTRHDARIYFSGFWSQGDGACFDGDYRYAKGSVAAVKAHAPNDQELNRIASALAEVQRKHFYKIHATIRHTGRYSHSGCTNITVYDDQRGDEWCADDETAGDVRRLLRDFMDWIYQQLEQEYEYQVSEEVVAETLMINEYEFTEEGERYRCRTR